MRLVIQRVTSARVVVDNRSVGAIDEGLLVLVGVAPKDTEADVRWLAKKTAQLRIFQDDDGKMNRSVTDIGGAVLVVSQFTLHGDCTKGNRPSYIQAAHPDKAAPFVDAFAASLREHGLPVETGEFGADMNVELLNQGPVTLLLESEGRHG